MNSETEDVDFPLTKLVLGQVAFDYIPRPILREIDQSKLDFQDSLSIIDDNGVKSLQVLLDNSNNQLKMYGTAKELADNLKIYRNFPFRHKVFGFHANNPYIKKLTEFRSLKGELFVRKDSFLRYCHSIIYEEYTITGKMMPSELVEYMKYQEKQCDKFYEFVRYDKDAFDRVFTGIAKLIAKPGGLPQSEEHEHLINQSEKESDFEIFQKIINTHPEIFLPYADIKNENVPIVVRIFEDGPDKFVMDEELFDAKLIRKYNKSSGKGTATIRIVSTMELNKVFKTFRNQMDNIEFIRIPITRAKHAAVPVVTPSGDHCILAADVLLELLRRCISALNIFQKIKNDDWYTVNRYISRLKSNFPDTMEWRYFLNHTAYNDIKRETDEFWEKYDNVPVKSVRDIRSDGFTMDDLKDELKYLGLTDVFPEITDYAENVYAEVYREKKEAKLRTCDMFEALEKCQLICIFKRFPNLIKLLHTQKACHRMPCIQCEMCPNITKIKPPTRSMQSSNSFEETNTSSCEKIEIVPVHAVKECSDTENKDALVYLQFTKSKKDINFRLDSRTFGKIVHDYIPHPLLNDIDDSKIQGIPNPEFLFDNGVEMLQILLDITSNKLGMYGTAQELAENLEIYRNFPLNHKKFFSNVNVVLNEDLVKYRSIKNNVFCCKQDLLLYILTAFRGKHIANHVSLSPKLDDYIKSQFERFGSFYEFFLYDKAVLDEIFTKIQNSIMKAIQMNNSIQNLVSIPKTRKESSEKLITNESEINNDIELFDKILDTYPSMFFTYWAMDDEDLPIVVRIFEDGPERFVMKSELNKVIGQISKAWNYRDLLHTIDLEDALEEILSNQMYQVEFIRYPITRAKHAAVPIVTPTAGHCMLAADTLLELLRRFIFALNIFQKIKHEEWNIVSEYMSLLEKTLPSDLNCKYFIDVFLFNDIRNNADNFWRKYENMSVKSVRDVGRDGFTVDDLKNELNYLELTDFFTEIANHAEDVYTEVDRVKREKKLRTCDMFDALEMCQVICILNRFPNLKRLLHSQKACHRVPLLQCESCSINSKRLAVDAEEIVMKFYNTSLDGNTENDEVTIPEHSQSGGETLPDNVATTKESIKTLTSSEDKTTECEEMRDKESETSSNDSNCCPNCQQFNKVLDETNEELRLTRIELEDAEKNGKINQKMIEEYAESNMNQKIVTDRMIEKAEIVTRQLTEQASDFKKCKEKLEKIIVAETKLKKSNKKLTEKNRSLEQEINRLKQKATADQKANISKKNQLEKEISDNRHINNEITEKNKGLEKELIQLKEKASLDQMRTKRMFEKKISENERVINELMEKNRKLEQDIIHLHQNFEKDQMESAKQQSRLEKEISENKRINIELQRSNACLSIQNEEHEKTIRAFSEWIAAVPSVPSGPVDSIKEDETPSGMRFQLVGFQKIKDSLRKKNPLKNAEDMVEELISLTNRPEIQRLGNYELMQFEGKFRNYSQTVEMNIQKLKDSGHCKDLSPLPEFPSFSERFMREYWSEIDKQPSTSSVKPSVTYSETSSELADSECLICTDPMESTDKTIKCETCKRRFHSTCASEWLKRKSVCPACSRGLLDPSEYPSLG